MPDKEGLPQNIEGLVAQGWEPTGGDSNFSDDQKTETGTVQFVKDDEIINVPFTANRAYGKPVLVSTPHIRFPNADAWWITLQQRVINLTGCAIEDLTPDQLDSLRRRKLTDVERLALAEYERCFPLPIITQARLRDAYGSPLREDDIRSLLLDGWHVEPGPLTAYIRATTRRDSKGENHTTYSVIVRPRRARQQKQGGAR